MAPAKLKGTSSSLVQSQEPIPIHPSLFKALSSASCWLSVVYPMGKCALILKGGANHSAILMAMVRVLLQLP